VQVLKIEVGHERQMQCRSKLYSAQVFS